MSREGRRRTASSAQNVRLVVTLSEARCSLGCIPAHLVSTKISQRRSSQNTATADSLLRPRPDGAYPALKTVLKLRRPGSDPLCAPSSSSNARDGQEQLRICLRGGREKTYSSWLIVVETVVLFDSQRILTVPRTAGFFYWWRCRNGWLSPNFASLSGFLVGCGISVHHVTVCPSLGGEVLIGCL